MSGHGTGGEPHEAPPVMTIPLIILAVASTIGWLLNAPFGGLDYISKWLAPVFPATIAPPFTVPTGTKWVIGVVATAAAFIGLAFGLRVWRGVTVRPALEPAIVRHGWYIDEGIAAAVSGPLAVMATDISDGDELVLDGAVNRLARFTAASGRQLRRLQTGYVRNYALGIGIGAALLLAYMATRVGR